jgi:5'(3')-deoxyribonucleotidase
MGVKVFEDGPRIFLDMDGVIADFDRAMAEYGAPAKVIKMIPGVYQHLKPLPGAIKGITELLAHAPGRVFICTKIPDKAPNAASEKLFWVHAWLPKMMGKVFIVPDKGAVGSSKDILVDDHPHWANAANFPGTVIHFAHANTGDVLEAIDTYPSMARVPNWEALVDLLKSIVPSNLELEIKAKASTSKSVESYKNPHFG